MYGKIVSACLQGIEGRLIEVEVDISSGLPQVNLVGLPDSAIRESTERVRAAIKNCGYTFPLERITVNLAPADLRKEGSSFDLAIAAGVLTTSGQIRPQQLERTLFMGELALDGSLRPVPGVLSMVHTALQKGITRIVLPVQNAREAMLVDGIEVCAISHLRELSEPCEGTVMNAVNEFGVHRSSQPAGIQDDFADVAGQLHAKRALMIAAAGMHNLILLGPPGTGKTMLIRRLPTILPLLSDQEALEVTKIYSVSGKLAEKAHLIRERPFRSPHHTVSAAGLVGGGGIPKPGEVSLAHRGVLFLDELPEFSRSVLEVLRQPLEDRQVTIGRARAVYTYPARFMLAASMNPCPCGYYGTENGEDACSCSMLKIQQYRSRISGPLLDRIDLHVEVPKLDYAALRMGQMQLSSAEMREIVAAAHARQTERYAGTGIQFNAELSGKLLRRFCRLDHEAETLLQKSFDAMRLSARAHDRILKIARTIADLEGWEHIEAAHLAEAIQYRHLDKRKI